TSSGDDYFLTAAAHNDIAHGYRPDDDATQRHLSILQNYYAQQVADFIDRLKAIPEGNGSVYDNTIILWANEFGDPARHLHSNVPFVLAGGASTFKKGRYLQFTLGPEESDPPTPHTQLLTSVVNQFGANLKVFGDPMYPGELPGL